MTFVAGPYSATFNGEDLGNTERGYELEYNFHEEPVIVDNFGESKVDGIYLGGDCFVNFVMQEYKVTGSSAPQSAFWPWDQEFGNTGYLGRCQRSRAKNLVLTALPGTKAQTNGPVTLTASLAILPGNFPIRMLFGSRHRKIPMRFQFLPADLAPATESGYMQTTWFTTT